jgi:IS30 family transposase
MPGNHLSQDERSKFNKFKQEGYRMDEIAELLGRHRSTLYREFKQRPGQGDRYCPALANEDAKSKRATPRKKSIDTPDARAFVKAKLQEELSPDAIAGRLKHERQEAESGDPGSLRPRLNLGTASIYKIIENDKNEGGVLFELLPRRGVPYRKNRTANGRSGCGKLPIKPEEELPQRQAMIEMRIEPGHFEMDLMFCGETILLTGIDRATRMPIMRVLSSKESGAIAEVVLMLCLLYRIRTITLDRGMEWAGMPEV